MQISHLYCRSSALLFALALTAVLVLSGCGGSSPYPVPQVTTLVGTPGVCDSCKQAITTVSEEHLVTIQGVQYMACDGECAAELEEWVSRQ